MQRASSLRAALVVLNELEGKANGQSYNHYKVPSPSQPVCSQQPESKTEPPTTQPKTAAITQTSSRTQPAPLPTTAAPNLKQPAKTESKTSPATPSNSIRLEAGMTAGHTVTT